METPSEQRAWLVACAWAAARRERHAAQQALLAAIWSPAAAQVAALRAAEPVLASAAADRWCRALEDGGGDLSSAARSATLGGAALSELRAAAAPDERRAAMALMADVLDDHDPDAGAVVRAAAAAHAIDQLVALWHAWTVAALAPAAFALVALTRARLLGRLGHDEHMLVAMRCQGLA